MTNRFIKWTSLISAMLFISVGSLAAAGKSASTVADQNGLKGDFPYQFELGEYEKKSGQKLSFNENPDIKKLNARITGNPALQSVADRLPEEPLVIQPYVSIGKYGGVLDGVSNATEAGTSDILSVRHVNLVRFSDDLQTIVPNVAKGWKWNDDFTELTFFLRKGHKWSDGQPFTSADIDFWYNDLILNKEMFKETPSWWLFGDKKPMEVKVIDETTLKMIFPIPSPGALTKFAQVYIQPFQPRHFYEKYHIKYNPKAGEEASKKDLKSWTELLNQFYGGTDWKDAPSPLLKGAADFVAPTLESHVLVKETTKGRRCVANPYFHVVDTAGNQLPYINEINETYISDKEVRNLTITNGQIDYKAQTVFIEDFPIHKEGESSGNYKIDLANGVGESHVYGFNINHKDLGLRKILGDVRFRQALSLAIDREEVIEIIYFGQAEPTQYLPAESNTVEFVTKEHLATYATFDPKEAKKLLDEMGLKDVDGDSFRERKDGSNLTLRLLYSNQGGPVKMHELIKSYWDAAGVRLDIKEVSSDEYREMGNNNELDLTFWQNDSTSGAVIVQNTFMLRPYFGWAFNPGTAYLWHEWKLSDGKTGVEPSEDAKKLYTLANKFVQYQLGSPESNKYGKEIVDIHAKNLWKIGIAGNVKTPLIHHNNLKNWGPYTVKSYDYYWAYPYRPFQWFLTE
ncbi:MAG: peptide ABC transporter substrate-binding protein [Desulfobulbaceae bacterium S3730MH12]|nr:MAG: peptide ABC transporter substrate-binding protein [Desulfobulbaceae bacterium S3730MH12]